MDPVFAASVTSLLAEPEPEALALEWTRGPGLPPEDVGHHNLHAYVRAVVSDRLTRGILRPLQAIVAGVHEIVPRVRRARVRGRRRGARGARPSFRVQEGFVGPRGSWSWVQPM